MGKRGVRHMGETGLEWELKKRDKSNQILTYGKEGCAAKRGWIEKKDVGLNSGIWEKGVCDLWEKWGWREIKKSAPLSRRQSQTGYTARAPHSMRRRSARRRRRGRAPLPKEQKQKKNSDMGEMGSPHMGKQGCWRFLGVFFVFGCIKSWDVAKRESDI